MKRPVYQYQPINESPDQAIGILLPFNNSSAARPADLHYASGSISGKQIFGQSYTTEQQVISNLKNLLLTRKGERVMQPLFGTDIYEVLFENNTLDLRSSLKKTLTKDIEYWLPYILINDINIISSNDMHTITIVIQFTITSIGANLVINILASENEFQVTDATPDLELRPISTDGLL